MPNIEVIKRNGDRVSVKFDSITRRNEKLAYGLDVDIATLSQAVISGLKDGIHTDEIDTLSCETAMSKAVYRPDYEILAKRVFVSNLHKKTSTNFSEVCTQLATNVNMKTGELNSLLSPDYLAFADQHKERIQDEIDYSKDYLFNYAGLKVLEKSYLWRTGGAEGRIVERPQHMFMRVALAIHGPNSAKQIEGNIDLAIETYQELANHKFIHATPTLFNSGSKIQQSSSCFLLNMDDKLDHIFKTFDTCAKISKQSGGIGISLKVRGKNSYIKSTNGKSGGIIPMIRVLNEVARYVDQCFTGETKVYTQVGLRPIQDICAGDKVLTQDGSWQMVMNTKSNMMDLTTTDNAMYKMILDCHGQAHDRSLNGWITGAHPFWAIKANCYPVSYIKKRVDEGKAQPEFMELDRLQVGDFVGFPVPQNQVDEQVAKLYTLDDCFFLGLRNSSFSKIDTSTGHIYGKYTNRSREFLEQYLTNHNSQFEYELEKNYLTFPQSFLLKNITLINLARILPCLSLKHVEHFLKGFLDDSLAREGPNKLVYKLDHLDVDTLHIISSVLLQIGILPTRTTENQLVVTGDFTQARAAHLKIGNVLFARIEKFMTKRCNSQLLYDLNIDKHTNYVTQFGLCHNGGGKRLGRIAVYLQPHHPDIMEFLEIRLNSGLEEFRARDIFPALWLPDLYFERVQQDGTWSLFDPSVVPELLDAYGEEYNKIYKSSELSGSLEFRLQAKKTKLTSVTFEVTSDQQAEPLICKLVTYDGFHFRGQQPIILSKSFVINSIVRFDDINRPESMTDKFVCNFSDYLGKEGTSCSFGTEQIECQAIIHPKFVKQVRARELWKKTITSLCETGLPYMLSKDSSNIKSMQKNIGPIRGSNLCSEIVEYHDPESIAVCNLASIALPRYVDEANNRFNFDELQRVVKIAIRNLNLVIDKNWYPVESAKTNNQNYRPIGLGVQGLADVFAALGLSWESDQAVVLNKLIFETMYFAAVEASTSLSKAQGSYSAFKGSPYDHGQLSYDLWNVNPITLTQTDFPGIAVDLRLNWTDLKTQVKHYGVRNSLMIALMPTNATSAVLGNSECFEPYTSNIFIRNGTAGEFIYINRHMLKDFTRLGLWTKENVDMMLRNDGSIKCLEDQVSNELKQIYKTVWEIPQKVVVKMAADRAPFVCQTQSMNIHLQRPTVAQLSSLYMYGHSLGLKTLSYYLRSKSAKEAVMFGLGNVTIESSKAETKTLSIDAEPDEICLSCQ